jgi:hypothetical protein
MHTNNLRSGGLQFCDIAYLFVFADTPIAVLQPPQGNSSVQ